MAGIGMVLLVSVGVNALGQAHEEHEHGGAALSSAPAQSGQEQTLTGEVVDVLCYLSHDKDALGKGHADCAKKCIGSGLPVAIKVGDQLYLAAMANHDPANKQLAEYAGEQVTVHGEVMEKDGQHLIAIESVKKAQ
jgi:hypothetical protein